MAKKDANNYGTRDQTEHQAEHQDESASDAKQSKYPGAKQPADWDRGDRQEQFATELEAIDEKAAAAFREGKNLLDDKVCENAGERKEHLSSYMNAFNNSFDRDKITPGERWEAAKDVSQAVFQPMYEETELIEAKNDEKFSPELYKALEKEGISDYWVNEATGQLEFNVTSTQQASRIAKMSKQEIRMLEGSSKGKAAEARDEGQNDQARYDRLDENREKFALALWASKDNPDTALELMNFTMENGDKYVNAEKAVFDGETTHENLSAMDPQTVQKRLESMSEHTWSETYRTIEDSMQGNPDEVEAIKDAVDAAQSNYLASMADAVNDDDAGWYDTLKASMERSANGMTEAIQEGRGILGAENFAGITSKDLTIGNLQEVVDEAAQALKYIRDNADPSTDDQGQNAIREVAENMEGLLRQGVNYIQDVEDDIEMGVLDESDEVRNQLADAYDRAGVRARALQYIMRGGSEEAGSGGEGAGYGPASEPDNAPALTGAASVTGANGLSFAENAPLQDLTDPDYA